MGGDDETRTFLPAVKSGKFHPSKVGASVGQGASGKGGHCVNLEGSGIILFTLLHPLHRVDTQAVIFAVAGFNKPIDVRFRDSQMFIVDFGVSNPATPTANTGKIWKVTP
jgi:hypothetical protein